MNRSNIRVSVLAYKGITYKFLNFSKRFDTVAVQKDT